MHRQYPQLFSNLGIFLSFEFSLFISRKKKVIKEGGFVTPRPKRVYGTCNRRVAYVHQGLP